MSDSHHEVARLDRSSAELETVELVPFRSAVGAGVRAVMTGHLVATALDERNLATVSQAITTTTLRDRLGFGGTVVTDALEMKAVSATIGMVEGFVQALTAGADAIETGALDYPELVQEIPRAVENAVGDGRLTEARLQEAATSAARLAQPGQASQFNRTLVDGAARRCLEVIGRVPEVHDPVVIECHPPAGMAGGELPWSLAAALGVSAQTVTQDSPPPHALVGCERGRTLIVVIRDPMRHVWQLPWIERARATSGAVLVDVGWPYEPLNGVSCVRTRGIAPGLIAAAAGALTWSGGPR
jgi:beta-N-acetylhexosaminidase